MSKEDGGGAAGWRIGVNKSLEGGTAHGSSSLQRGAVTNSFGKAGLSSSVNRQ